MLTPGQIEFLRKELLSSQNPLFIYDDDPDGLCSFLLLYRLHPKGKGTILKSAPKLDIRMLRKVDELQPDKIFILDVPIVDQEFIDGAKRPIFWIDHHQPLERKNVHYFNPRIADKDAYIPTTRMAYQINDKKEDLWIAMVGCLSDWHSPDFLEEFMAKYPLLITKKGDLTALVYHEPLGELVKVFSFLIKGSTSEVRNSIKILSRITSPEEILQQQTAQGKFLYRRYQSINKNYQDLLKTAKKKVSRGRVIVFNYTEDQWSFTSNLANELVALHPQKVVIIARNKSGKMKCSLRARFAITPALEKSLAGLEGAYGGGHPQACGAVMDEKDWETFLERFKEEIKNASIDS